MGMSETQMLNQIWFEIHGGDKVKAINKDIADALKQIQKESDLAQQSIDKVVKKWSTLAQTPQNMSNISSAIYSKQERRQITSWSRNTHSTPKYLASDYYNEGTVDYSAARTAWKALESEQKKQAKLQSDITKFLEEGKSIMQESVKIDEEINEQKQKLKKATEKKVKELTAYQKEKIRVEDEHNDIRRQRNSIEAAAEARKRERDNSNYAQYRNAHPELFAVGGLYHSARFQTGHAFQALGGIASTLGSGGRAVGLALDSLGAFFKAIPLGIATTISNLAKGITELGKASVQAYSEIEAIKTQLGVVFSNQTQADSMFGDISQYAVKSPFGVQQTSELAVLLKQSGVYASDLMDTLKMLGDTAGGNMEKMKRIANNYAQIVSIGKASMLDMRQFAYAGIPIFEAVSKELGVSQQELRKLISDGKVTADIIEKVFKDLTGINGIFENATEKGAKTLKARLQNLADAKQLALGSLGSRIVNAGTETGGDSFLLNFVSTAEEFFSWVKEHNDTRNIERDVETIANNNRRISELEVLLKYAKDTGDKDLQKLIETELATQRAMFDADKQRAIYAESYDIKHRDYNAYQKQFGNMNTYQIRDAIAERSEAQDILKERLSELNEKSRETNLSQAEWKELQQLQAQIDLYDILIEDLKGYSEAIKEVESTTEEEIKANRERNIINAQQLAFDQAQKEAGQEGAYSAAFDKLYSIYTTSDEYKQQKEQEELKFLQEAQEALKKLADFVDSEGHLDMTKLAYQDFSSFYNRSKAFDPSKKLTVVEGKSDSQMTADRAILTKQWNDMSQKIANELGADKQYAAMRQFLGSKLTLDLSGDNKSFFENFDVILEQQLDILKRLAESSSDEEETKRYQEMYNNLLASTFQLDVNTKGKDANLEAQNKKGATEEFIPLWKRILSSATGLSTAGMTDVGSTIANYTNDMAIRNMASGVLAAALKSTDMNTALGLMKTSGNAKVLRGTSQGVYQVDWLETKKAMHDFATQLSASTDVIAAYKKGLEDELAVYQQLIVAGYTEGESQDLKNQKTISSKQFEKLSKDLGDQLVNAYGRKLTTAEGMDVTYRNGKYYDEKGYEVQVEQLRMTDELYDMIKDRFEQLQQEIHEATISEANNKLLEEMYSNTAANQLLDKFLSNEILRNSSFSQHVQAASFVNQHPEYANTLINSSITTHKKAFANVSKMSNEDILMYGTMSQAGIKKRIAELKEEGSPLSLAEANRLGNELKKMEGASAALTMAFAELEGEIIDLSDKGVFKDLEAKSETKTRDEAVSDRMLAILAERNEYGEIKGKQVTPEDYIGKEGFKNWLLKNEFGIDKAYDMEDLFIKAVQYGMGTDENGNKINVKDKSGNDININDYYKTGENGEQILDRDSLVDAISEADKATIAWLENLEEVKNTMKDLGASALDAANAFTKGSLTKTTETLGKNLITAADASSFWDDTTKDLKTNMKALAAEQLESVGAAMTEAGWKLVAMGAEQENWGLIGAGLALAAAGGFASGIGGALKESDKDKDKSDKEAQRLENLKSDLQKLLEQARTDALYYENNLRHQTALGINKGFSYKTVNDAIITPSGQVVETDPKDYLIATKTPQQLAGGQGNVTVQPVINCNVVNNSSAQVRTEQQQNADGSIDIITVIEEVAGSYIASSRSDEAFASRDFRMQGKQAVM